MGIMPPLWHCISMYDNRINICKRASILEFVCMFHISVWNLFMDSLRHMFHFVSAWSSVF